MSAVCCIQTCGGKTALLSAKRYTANLPTQISTCTIDAGSVCLLSSLFVAMSLEYILDDYPKKIQTKGGLPCEARPLEAADEISFHEFFLAVPTHERMFIKHRVTEPEVI